MAAPPNTTAATATVMTIPYSATLDVSEAPGALHPVWYAYTPAEDECEIGFWAFADLAGTYAPATTVYVGTPSSLTIPNSALQNVVNRPIQVPITHGETYYFEVQASAGGAVTTLLQVSLIAAGNTATAVGSIAINDDTDGFPMAIFSASTGGPEQYRPFPAGEYGSLLTTGVSLWQGGEQLELYSATLQHVTTPSWVFEGDAPITSNRTGTFYVADNGVAVGLRRVTTISAAGVLGPTTWLLPDVAAVTYAIAVSLDDAVLYYFEQGSTLTSEIKRFDLVANTPLSSFAADVSGYTSRKDLLVLLDDTVIVGYLQQSPSYDSFVRHYARNGSLLHTYALGDVQLNRLSFALDDPASFWTWSNLVSPNEGRSRFANIRISDGAILTTFDTQKFEHGIYAGPVSATPAARFGHSQSCGFVVFPFTVPPCGNGGGGGGPEPPRVAPSYHLDARYIRRLRRAPHVNNEHTRVFFRKFELDLERGQGLATGQGSDPMVLLRISRDGGQTWGEEQRMAAGRLGDYTQRVIARRLGQARDTVFEVVVSDPIAWSLVGAWLDLEAGTS